MCPPPPPLCASKDQTQIRFLVIDQILYDEQQFTLPVHMFTHFDQNYINY
jgi:hypothetical protein